LRGPISPERADRAGALFSAELGAGPDFAALAAGYRRGQASSLPAWIRDEPKGGPMSALRKIAEIPAGRWTRWLVVAIWLVVIAVALPLSFKLKGVEKDNTSQWLPANAESTKALAAQSHFQSPISLPRSLCTTAAPA